MREERDQTGANRNPDRDGDEPGHGAKLRPRPPKEGPARPEDKAVRELVHKLRHHVGIGAAA